MQPYDYVKNYYRKFKTDEATSMKDKEALITLIELYSVRSVFEIGTWKGEASLFIYLHPQIEKLKTIDINKNMDVDFIESDIHPLMEPEFYGSFFKSFAKIEFQFCDSMNYTPLPNEQYDMIFIDGSKEKKYVYNDYLLALKFNPKIIIWHDYYDNEKRVKPIVDELTKGGAKQFPNSIVGYYVCNLP